MTQPLPTSQAPLARVSLIDLLVGRLENLILDGDFPAGSKLPGEAELARDFGVSRPVIREGLSRLRERGYLETVNGRGTFVQLPGVDHLTDSLLRQIRIGHSDGYDVDHLYEARTAIEVTTARLAADRADADDLTRLQTLVDEMTRSATQPSAYTAADMSFHIAVANAARNPFLSLMLQPLSTIIIEGILTSSKSRPDGVADGIRMHGVILAAIRRHDSAAAASAMVEHLQDSRRSFPESVLVERARLTSGPGDG